VVFLILLLVAWAMVMVPSARKERWAHPAFSTVRYRSSMRMVAPRTRYEVRRAALAAKIRPSDRTAARRREIVVFLGAGASFAALAATLSDRAAAWPVSGVFAGLLLFYVAAVIEVDRRKVANRVAARRRARAAEDRSPHYEDYAEAV
jgi:hypothetical protein